MLWHHIWEGGGVMPHQSNSVHREDLLYAAAQPFITWKAHTQSEGASHCRARVWSWSKHMLPPVPTSLSHQRPAGYKKKNSKSKFPPCNPAPQITSSRLSLCLSLLQRAQRLAVINPSFVLGQSDRPTVLSQNIQGGMIWIFAPRAAQGHKGSQKNLD